MMRQYDAVQVAMTADALHLERCRLTGVRDHLPRTEEHRSSWNALQSAIEHLDNATIDLWNLLAEQE